MRSYYRALLALSVLAALASCDDAQSPFDPAAEGVPSPAAEPVTPSDAVGMLTTSRIVFMAYTASESSAIWTVDPQASGSYVHLTSTGASGFSPAWSYDHKKVAYVRTRLGADKVSHLDICVMNADGTNKHWARSVASPNDLFEPAWSPDGTRLVVTIRLQGSPFLATLDLSTGNLALVGPKGAFAVRGRQPSYDPTGKAILYRDELGTKLHRLVPGGEDKVLLTAAGSIESPTFSPDGTKVAYGQYVSISNREIYVLSVATGTSKRLTFNGAIDASPTWSPDGTKLAFTSHRSGSDQIWTMNAATGGSLTRITYLPSASNPGWWH